MPRQRSPRAEEGGVTLGVRIQPRASKNSMVRLEDGTLKIRLTAPPVDGAANEALVAFLAHTFGVARSQVEILSGHTARQKVVRITGIDDRGMQRVLNTPDK
jgi:uncharacterized protein (TIGR00251 family)